MCRIWKYVGIAALVVVLGLGTVATVALAQGTTDTAQGPFSYYERFRQTLAAILGISVEQYDSAVAQARDQTLDDLVAEGWLTQDQADRMRQRLEKPMDGKFSGRLGRGPGPMRGGWAANPYAIAAEQLAMDEAELEAALREGQTIAGLAREKGVDPQAIVDAYVAELTAQLDQAVADGRMTQKMADWTIEQARTQVTGLLESAWEGGGPGTQRPRGLVPGGFPGRWW